MPPEPERWMERYPAAWRVAFEAIPLPEAGPPPAEEMDRLVGSFAFGLERDLRAYLAGRQFTGIVDSRHVLVTNASPAYRLERALALGAPGPEALARLGEALWLLEHATQRCGLRLLEYDRPGYDDVTRAFVELVPRVARRDPPPDVPPFEEPGAWTSPYPPWPKPGDPPSPAAQAILRRRRLERLASALFLIAAALVIVWLVSVRPGRRRWSSGPPPKPRSCAESVAGARARLERERQRVLASTDPAASRVEAALAQALADLEAGRYDAASARLRTDPDVARLAPLAPPEAALTAVECFLDGVAKAPSPPRSP